MSGQDKPSIPAAYRQFELIGRDMSATIIDVDLSEEPGDVSVLLTRINYPGGDHPEMVGIVISNSSQSMAIIEVPATLFTTALNHLGLKAQTE